MSSFNYNPAENSGLAGWISDPYGLNIFSPSMQSAGRNTGSGYSRSRDTDTLRATTAIANQNRGFGRYGETLSDRSLDSNPNLPNAEDDSNFLQRLMGGDEGAYNTVQAGLGIGQLGLGLASYLQQRDMAKKQGKLLDQQISNNKFEMGNREKLIESFRNR